MISKWVDKMKFKYSKRKLVEINVLKRNTFVNEAQINDLIKQN